ncbi:unnamed protein product [Brassica oleracea]|uniref:(rape) hypothetical protein n=1 Tax=Brassica napus TaxID=3708 RepID=A0A816U0T3_BRANA|nr:unnamed protein product [Brassica napus]
MSMEASNVEALDEATALRERDFKCGSKTGCPYRNHVERCLEDPAMP